MPRAGRRTAIVDLDNGSFPDGRQQHPGMIAVGYPAAQAASMAMPSEGGLRYTGLNGQQHQPQHIYQQHQIQQQEAAYRRVAARPPPAGPNGALPQYSPQSHAQMPPAGGYGTPVSAGPSMSAAQYNAYVAASNSIPGGHPAPRSLQQQPMAGTAILQQRPPYPPGSQHPSIASPASVMTTGGFGNAPASRMLLQQQTGAPVPASVFIDTDGNAVQPVYRVASQPQPIARPQINGGPPIARPEMAGQRSFSQNQVQQIPRQAQQPINAMPEPLTPQQQHAMYHQQQMQQQQQQLRHRASLVAQTPVAALSSPDRDHQRQQEELTAKPNTGSQESSSSEQPPQAPTIPTRQPSVVSLEQPFFDASRRFSTSPMPLIPEQEQEQKTETLAEHLGGPRPQVGDITPQAPAAYPVATQGTVEQVHQQQNQPVQVPQSDPLLSLLPPASILQPSPLGIATLRLLQLGQALTAALAQPGMQSLQAWVEQFYCEEAHVRFDLAEVDHGQNVYHIPVAALARFYDVLRESGAISFQLLLESPKEYALVPAVGLPPTGHLVECDRMTWIVGYSSGCQVFSKGTMRARFTRAPAPPTSAGPTRSSIVQIDFMEYVFEEHTEFIERAVIKQQQKAIVKNQDGYSPASVHSLDFGSPMKQDEHSDDAASPAKRKRSSRDEDDEVQSPPKKPKAASGVEARDYARTPEMWENCAVPVPAVGPAGVSDRAMRILEIAECIDLLGEVISFSSLHGFGPLDALERYATFCVDTGAASRDTIFSPASAVKPALHDKNHDDLAFSQSDAFMQDSQEQEIIDESSMTAGLVPPPSAPLPSVARLAPFTDDQYSAAMMSKSVPSSPVDFEPMLMYRSNTMPGYSI